MPSLTKNILYSLHWIKDQVWKELGIIDSFKTEAARFASLPSFRESFPTRIPVSQGTEIKATLSNNDFDFYNQSPSRRHTFTELFEVYHASEEIELTIIARMTSMLEIQFKAIIMDLDYSYSPVVHRHRLDLDFMASDIRFEGGNLPQQKPQEYAFDHSWGDILKDNTTKRLFK